MKQTNKTILAITMVMAVIVLSGCIESNRPDLPMRKIVEYPVVATFGHDTAVIMLEDGKAIAKCRGSVSKMMGWKLVSEEESFHLYEITGASFITIQQPYRSDEKFIARDLIIRNDMTAAFGSLKNDVFLDDGHWY